jgi:hypothetical protein
MKAWLLVFALMALRPAVSAGAEDARLVSRLDAATARTVSALADSARAENLPGEALVQRALEGVTKGAAGDRIALAVRGLLNRLREARRTLGARATPEDLVAAASALQVGVPGATLSEIKDARTGSLIVPLVVLADLVGRGVEIETATTTILFMARAGVEDDRFLDFRNRVEKDIGSGVSPGTAATIRAGGAVTGSRGTPPPIRRTP